MRFNIIFLVFCLALGCSAGGDYDGGSQTPRVGVQPVKAVTNFSSGNSSGSKEGTAYMIDEQYNQVLEVQVDPFKIVNTHQVPGQVKADSLLAGQDGRYFLIIGLDNYAIISADGSSEVNPIEFYGEIVSAAFDTEGGRLVVVDEFSTVGMLELSKSGAVKDSWAGGPLFDDDATFIAGTLIPDGPLVLSRTDGKLAVIDFEESIAQREWIYELIEPETAEFLNQLEPEQQEDEEEESGDLVKEVIEEDENAIPELVVEDEDEEVSSNPDLIWLSTGGDGQTVFARSDEYLFMINIETGEVIDGVEPTDIIAHFDQAIGHVVSMEHSNGTYKVYYADDGELKTQVVKTAPLNDHGASSVDYLSILNLKEKQFSITYGPYGNYEAVYRFNLTDSRLISINETPVSESYNLDTLEEKVSELAVCDDHLIYLHPNSLGKLERRSLGKDTEPMLIKGFNIKNALGK